MLHSLLLAALLSSPGQACELADVSLPDTIQLGGQTLLLNGIGLREMLFIDIYVGGMYLPSFTASDVEAIQADVPKRMVMHFIFSEVSREKMIETFQEGLERNPSAKSMGDRAERLYAVMETCHAGDQVVLDYVPGAGLSIYMRGELKDTIPGADFMQAVWTLFIGPVPPSKKLKQGLLSGCPAT
jgi:hypothetical protein